MPMKAPAPAPAPFPSWTGWYVGGNLGASFGHVKTDINVTPILVNTETFSSSFAGTDISHPSGFIGGGQIGYNWQYSPLIVVGLEADFQGALEKETNNWGQPFHIFAPSELSGTQATNYTTEIDWFGTVRARIGYLWGDGAVLTYLTGGLAYGEVKINGTSSISGAFTGTPTSTFGISQAFGHSQVNTGWVVGYGMEGKLLIPGWTYRIESLYMDLGTLDTAGVTTGAFTANISCIGANVCPVGGGHVTTHSHFTDGILRAGLNYQFH
jgi:outer membrane immunogenic protein